ncbi:MAG: hypothetical protein Q8941_21565 [Bacteroidota bacterium]|nr:hypothetical protein [Bacteroidota bacterium]
MTIRFQFTLLGLMAFSCSEPNLKLIEEASYQGLKKERLGQSTYYVKIPSNTFIDEARGKEGQLGYGLYQIDSVKRNEGSSGFIEIEHGNPISGDSDNDKLIEKVRSHLLDGSTKWKITKTETGYFNAVAHHGKLRLDASSPTRTGLDSMIAIIATLSSR